MSEFVKETAKFATGAAIGIGATLLFVGGPQPPQETIHIVEVECPEDSMPGARLLRHPASMAVFTCITSDSKGGEIKPLSVTLSEKLPGDPGNFGVGRYIVDAAQGEVLTQYVSENGAGSPEVSGVSSIDGMWAGSHNISGQ
jgi:hypothetical protein